MRLNFILRSRIPGVWGVPHKSKRGRLEGRKKINSYCSKVFRRIVAKRQSASMRLSGPFHSI